ncbi:hypothetical protein [Gordonia aurantiaca]|uniref:hypothetical protein n=1 Tax=Gordonia sp. B21 TaxID=3151852 RepID=UPI003267A45E
MAEHRAFEPGSRRVSMDTDQVSAVASFYRRSALVVNAVADDLAAHDFGRWAHPDATPAAGSPSEADETLSRLAGAYAEMSATLSRRLRAQSRAADLLAARLREAAEIMSAGDAEAAAGVSRAVPESR